MKSTSYDDRFALAMAADNDGVIISNDNYGDLLNENSGKYVVCVCIAANILQNIH